MGKLFGWPTPLGLGAAGVCFCLGVALDAVLCLLLRKPVKIRPLGRFAFFLLFGECCQNRVLLVAGLILYLLFHHDDFPWRKLGKQLGSKLSGLTEVACASLQRQQAEAFS